MSEQIPAHQQNRRSWNAVTAAHNSHKHDQAAYLQQHSTLFPEEVGFLEPLSGQRLLHLQCNCGQDTLSFARHHGATVTGIDISDNAIAFAQDLSETAGIPAVFERSDVLEWLPQAAKDGRTFDRVLLSYGTIGWVGDLDRYLKGIAQVLAPGGVFVLMEFHPLVWCFSESGQIIETYFDSKPLHENEGVNDYVGLSGDALTPSGWRDGVQDFVNPEPTVEFQWTIAQIVQAVLRAGLVLEQLEEYPYANGWSQFPSMKRVGNVYEMPEGLPAMPRMLGVQARRPA